MALTAKQQRFVEEYCVDFNATKAAHRASYSGRSRTVGHNLLKRPDIAAAIAARRRVLATQTDLTIEQVRDELWKLAQLGAPDATRVAALTQLMRHLGGFVDKVEQTIKGGKLNVTVVYADGPLEDAE